MDSRPFNILSLCSGAGGLELGLRLAVPSARTICYVENEAYAAEVLASRMEDSSLDQAPIWSDIRTFDGQPWCGVVDCITAGYPCQPFSVAGKRRGTEDSRHLWPYIHNIIQDVGSSYVFCENVDRHLSVGFDEVSADLEEMGYRIAAGLFTASEVGAPHKRRRLYFLAYSKKFQSSQLVRRNDGGRSGSIELNGLPLKSRGSSLLERRSEWWDVEPDVGRVADGTSSQVDRLRATGNGVVPLVAAYAFTTLLAELDSHDRELLNLSSP